MDRFLRANPEKGEEDRPDITAVPERFVASRHQHVDHHAQTEHVRGWRGVVGAPGLASSDMTTTLQTRARHQPPHLAISGAMKPTVLEKETLAWPVLSKYFARPKSISLI